MVKPQAYSAFLSHTHSFSLSFTRTYIETAKGFKTEYKYTTFRLVREIDANCDIPDTPPSTNASMKEDESQIAYLWFWHTFPPSSRRLIQSNHHRVFTLLAHYESTNIQSCCECFPPLYCSRLLKATFCVELGNAGSHACTIVMRSDTKHTLSPI